MFIFFLNINEINYYERDQTWVKFKKGQCNKTSD